jgi:hypothetical protein
MIGRGRLLASLCGILLSGSLPLHAAPGPVPAAVLTAPTDRRGEEQTFLTFPEWFLVFSPTEYAQFVRTHTPDGFCFWGHIGQFWRGYATVIHELRVRDEPANPGYHVMITVIGLSTTVEYGIRSAYETLVGRLTAAIGGGRSAEDDYAAQVAQEYVDFIRIEPWYEFDFLARLKGLWTRTDLFGPHLLRKWERRYALTTEYLIKAGYGRLIRIGTHASYDAPIPTTTVVTDHWPVCDHPPANVAVLKTVVNGETLLALPRYEPFRVPAVALTHCGAVFKEIAGNRGVILVSAIGPTHAVEPPNTEAVMRQPIITQSGRERIVLVVPVAQLARTLVGFDSDGLVLEHLFDY